jgi:tryptophan synthase alpha chain
VIQRANERALAAGATTERIFEMVERLRRKVGIPLVFLTYVNPIHAYGYDRFFERCQEAGIDGIVIPDLPFEEKEELLPFAKAHGVALISLIAPTSADRIAMIAREAEGFIYCVSSLGVTGVRNRLSTDINDMIGRVRAVSNLPVAVGFGISTPEQAARVGEIADGVIVGSAIVRIIEEHGEAAAGPLADYVRSMKKAIR